VKTAKQKFAKEDVFHMEDQRSKHSGKKKI
jgi:hypothetical protein